MAIIIIIKPTNPHQPSHAKYDWLKIHPTLTGRNNVRSIHKFCVGLFSPLNCIYMLIRQHEHIWYVMKYVKNIVYKRTFAAANHILCHD